MIRRYAIAPLLAILLMTGCGAANFATSLRLVVAAGAPVLDLLVQQGKISPELRTGLITDLTNEGFRVGDMANCFNAIPQGDAQSKLKHLQCVQTLAQAPETQKLIRDFGKNPNVQMIADDFNSILQAAIIFYGGANAPIAAGATAPSKITEAEIQARVKKLKADLGQK